MFNTTLTLNNSHESWNEGNLNELYAPKEEFFKNQSQFTAFCLAFKSSPDDEKNFTNIEVNSSLILDQFKRSCVNVTTVTPAEEYWECVKSINVFYFSRTFFMILIYCYRRRVLMLSSGIEDIGGMQWELLCLLGLSWILIYVILGKGLSQSGKVIIFFLSKIKKYAKVRQKVYCFDGHQIVWFIAMFPYLIMGSLLIRAVTLEGAGQGIKYLITPRWEYLMNSDTWIEGTTQIFFGYSVGVGTLPALGSFNRFNHNCYR